MSKGIDRNSRYVYREVRVRLGKTEISIAASGDIAHALEEIAANRPTYAGVPLASVLTTVYWQARHQGMQETLKDLRGRRPPP